MLIDILDNNKIYQIFLFGIFTLRRSMIFNVWVSAEYIVISQKDRMKISKFLKLMISTLIF